MRPCSSCANISALERHQLKDERRHGRTAIRALVILPVLQQDDPTAAFFPCCGLIGEKTGPEEYMSAADLAHLTASGFWVEDHTYNDGTALWRQPLS